MKKALLIASLLILADQASAKVAADSARKNQDTLPKTIEEVMVSATRAAIGAPVTQTTVSRKEIQIQNTGRDLPVLLQFQPGVTVTTDAGAGIGYTGIRVRGSDATRTNVTVNGVPINDAESHGTFWVNMPDMATGLSSVQIQRGAGTSTHGAGAFGATVNMQTFSSEKPYLLFSNTAGSFGTMQHSISGGTGLVNKHWTADFRLSSINSDGYVDRASSKLRSYMAALGYQGKGWSVKWMSFGGKEQTYQAWWGVPKEKLQGSESDLINHYYRNLGVTYKTAADSANLFGSNPRTYNYYTYPREIDDYTQNHHHLYFTAKTGVYSFLSATLYYTRGLGFFEQFRHHDKLSNYLIPPTIVGTDTITRSDIGRRRWLDNHLLGGNINWNQTTEKSEWIMGFGFNEYNGKHYGRIVWASMSPQTPPDLQYYGGSGFKLDASFFVKNTRKWTQHLQTWIDLQYRWVYHSGTGTDNDLRTIDFIGNFGFFNPKAGLTYQINNQRFYGSVSIANREPSRSDFTDHKTGDVPKPEQLTDWELGWNHTGKTGSLFVNVYYMNYRNQLVLTGEVNDVGSALRRNVEESFRRGIEMGFEQKLAKQLKAGGNLSLSQNRIKSIVNVIPDYFTYQQNDSVFNDVPIAMSPDINGAFWLEYTLLKNTSVRYIHKYVGRQYLDNTGDKYRSLNPYQFAELWLQKSYTLKSGAALDIQLQVLNVFNSLYSSNGYTFMYTYGSRDITQEVFLYPQAGRNFMGGITLRF
ncbi:MAG: TonB-dependent receptor [Sphingomonadales bacterium]